MSGTSNLYSNPCYKESQESLKCLDRNNYNRDACQMYFDNYNVCKKFWGNIEAKRRLKGITPYMPDYEEREKIKAEMKSKKNEQT